MTKRHGGQTGTMHIAGLFLLDVSIYPYIYPLKLEKPLKLPLMRFA
jgi:hypothetical protein